MTIANASCIVVRFRPPTLSIIPQQNKSAGTSIISISTPPPTLSIFRTLNPIVPAEIASAKPIAIKSNLALFVRRNFVTDRRTQRTAWQGRLGSKLDTIRTKMLDNTLLLTAHPTDMIRIRTERDERSHDVKSRTIIAAEVLPIVLPIMEDIPMRRMIKDGHKTVITFSMMEEQKPFEILSALSNQLYRDDLLFRVIKDPYSDSPYLLVLQIKDELATMAYSSLLYIKYKATIFDEKLPEEVVNQVVEFAKKREMITW